MSINKPSIYFVPGFDPVGPSRYAAYFVNTLREVHPPNSIHVQAYPSEGGPSNKRLEWKSFILTLNKANRSTNIDLRIADYTGVIKDHWNYGYLEILFTSFNLLVEMFRKKGILLLNKDFRLYCFRLYVLCLFQISWLMPILLVSVIGTYLASFGASFTAAAPLLLGIWVLISWLCYSVLKQFKLVWLLKALLFEKKLCLPNDKTLEVAALTLADQLVASQSQNPSSMIYLISHSSGISLLLLVIFNLQGYSDLLSKIRVITYGRALGFPLGNQRIRNSIYSLFNTTTATWMDVTSREDLLSNSLLSPADYIGADSASIRNLSILDSTPHSSTKPQNLFVRLISRLLNQFDIHMKYLTSRDVGPHAEGSKFYTITELLYKLLT